jgi:tetratricopeptide (TPR) repeat protein
VRGRLAVAALVCTFAAAGCGESAGDVPVFDAPERIDPEVAAAIDASVAAARQQPGDGAALGRLGRIYHANEFDELATRCYQAAARLDATSPEWPYYLGVLHAERGRADDAAARFREVTALDAGYAPAWARLGDALLAAGELDAAGNAYRRYLEQLPGGPWGLVGLAKIARRSGRFEDAGAHLEQALDAEPRHKPATYLLATVYRELGREDDAARQLQRFRELGISIAPPDPLIERMEREATGAFGLMRRANAMLSTGRLDEAEGLYWEIVTRRPDEYTAVVNLAQTYMRLRRFDEARALWQRAVELRPQEPHGHYGLAQSFLQTSRRDAAMAELIEVLRLDPGHAEASRRLRQLSGGAADAPR